METRAKCSYGALLYKVNKIKLTIKKVNCIQVKKHDLGHFSYKLSDNTTVFSRNFDNTIFDSAVKAKEALEEATKIAKKRALLKEYEQQLNTNLKIKNHNYIK